MMGAPDSAGRRLLFPRALPRLPVIMGGADHEKKRKIAVKCLELEEMLEKQGHSQTEIETKVSSFRCLLLRQLTTVNNNGLREIPRQQEEAEENRQSRSSDEERQRKSHKRKKKRRKESRGRKKKKERRARRHSSPTYSDYEPENPLLRNKRRPIAGASQEKGLDQHKGQEWKKERKKRKRNKSDSRSRSSSRSSNQHKPRKEERKKKKKKRKALQDEDTSNQETLGEPVNDEETEANSEQVEILENNVSPSRESQPESSLECNGTHSSQELTNSTESNQLEKIEDIPTVSDNPKFINIFTTDSRITGSSDSSTGSYTKLKFEMKPTSKRNHLVNKAAQSSTFAELSNRLGPTVNLHSRKVGGNGVKSLGVEARERNNEGEDVGCGAIQSANTVAEDMELDENEDQVEEEEEEVVYLKTSNSRSKTRSRSRSYSRSRSRSRSYSYSRSRSRSYSYSSYSRSRSRSYSYSRSRSRSYSYSSYSSRSRSRSRSPSIVRRRGSPSFLDKRRITSARKRPIPYHRPSPSPASSHSETSSDDESPHSL